MAILKIYIDTSVIGGCFDPDFAPWSNGLMEDLKQGRFRPLVSDLVTIEIERAPQEVKEKYAEILKCGADILTITEETLDLVAAYRRHKILEGNFENDRTHIALATIYKADILVSWNFKHIVHFDKIRMFNLVNQKMGYKIISIHSPREVTRYEKEED